MTNQQKPEALRLADKYEVDGFLQDHRFAQNQWCMQAAVELRRLHAENTTLQQGYDAARMEIEGLRDRVQELGAMLRENRSKRIVELEAQLEAIGAGGVEPLRRRECLHKISEPEAASQPPAGWVMVPEVPDERMERAIAGAFCGTVYEARKAWESGIAAAPKATPVPVVEQEELREGASYESMNLAVMVLSDCGHSSNYKPLLERVAGRIDRHVERLLTAQQADSAMRAKAAPDCDTPRYCQSVQRCTAQDEKRAAPAAVAGPSDSEIDALVVSIGPTEGIRRDSRDLTMDKLRVLVRRALATWGHVKVAPNAVLYDPRAVAFGATPTAPAAPAAQEDGHSTACLYQYALARLGIADSKEMRVIFWDAHEALKWDDKTDSYLPPVIDDDCAICGAARSQAKEGGA